MDDKIQQLLAYGLKKGFFVPSDEVYCRNQILQILHQSDFKEETQHTQQDSLQTILDSLIDYAIQQNIIPDTQSSRDSLDARLMNAMLPRPSQVIETFSKYYQHSPEEATDYYYDFSRATNYIHVDRIKKDKKWITKTKYGEIDITINLSKPEKDPRDIAKAKSLPPAVYPKCLLCRENEGYSGSHSHPARNNHRLIPLTLHGATYFLQYSPYSYYNEHCIVLNKEHIPMKIDRTTFCCLLDFVDQFPHYFIGSNADLPIVGGSILTHDHFQGGRYTFAMERAPMLDHLHSAAFPHVTYGRIYWPLSVIRLQSEHKEQLLACADFILNKWRSYSDEELGIYAKSEGALHNTITPIARKKGNLYELDLTLRNNRTSKKHPLGIFHPHEEFHHIKKENIGLIEVMGLAVLPARLLKELHIIQECLLQNHPLPQELQLHQPWYSHLKESYSFQSAKQIQTCIEDEVGHIFEQVLENAGVFKQDKRDSCAFYPCLRRLRNETKSR